ncbi:similar to Saccharomyces cerevisiae YMR185W RTP1 Putative protein of unknown function [Maudiozyma saulgeensis]|uniref:RNA polymerase II assembly factor Rtp1 C-terminal domain-containing protein n=1 Tax=Maudiozyma saulgeensis TaxID=1789683 RepID=A0A1X7R074_9SACH|nr:similar to Saccharomyces cerevisiae YMR185W RTP1 Putative protein of unknown function [Kazachstania saulgeensis]
MTERQSVKDLLNKGPEFVKGTPLDIYFEHLSDELFKPLVQLQKEEDNNQSVYQYLGFENNDMFVSKLLEYFGKLHELVLDNQKDIIKDKSDLLPISLHDMRYVDALVNLLMIHGIDANIPDDVRIPMDSKRLTQFKEDDKRYEIPKAHRMNISTLKFVIDSMYEVLSHEKAYEKDKNSETDYLRPTLLKGSAFTNVFLGTLVLVLTDPENYERKLNSLEAIQETYTLFSMYTLLTETLVNKEAKVKVINLLSTLVIRREEDGLLSLIDFILGVRENEDIDAEKMSRINQILLSRPPKVISNKVYLQNLFDQIYDSLTYVNRPIVVMCVNNIIKDFFLRNKRIVRDFLFKRVYQILLNSPVKNHTAKELNDMVNVLISLSKNSSVDVVKDLVSGLDGNEFFLTLWIYALFLKKNQKVDPLVANSLKTDNFGPYYEVILSLMKSFLFILDDYDTLDYLSLHLLNTDHEDWEYRIDLETQLAYINEKGPNNENLPDLKINGDALSGENMNKMSKLFQDMDISIELYIEFLKLLDNEESIKDEFLNVLKRWVQQTFNGSNTEKSSLINLPKDTQTKNILILTDIKLLEKMNENFKSGLIRNVSDILEVINDLLDLHLSNAEENQSNNNNNEEEEEDSDDEEDEVGDDDGSGTMSTLDVIFELLKTIIDQTPSAVLQKNKNLLLQINEKIKRTTTASQGLISASLTLLLSDSLKGKDNDSQLVQNEINDNEKLDKALRNIADPLVPIKVHGLMELRKFVENGSTIIAPDRVFKLHLQYLRNPDPFIYLNVIKGLSSLCEYQPEMTLGVLIEFYQDRRRRNKMDDILKVGEVFINYIQRENQLFQGKYANMIIDVCLERIQGHTKVDNKIRMSAMSILGVCLQVNAKGVSTRISEMLDCVFGILQFETDESINDGQDDTFIMRRSAIRLIYDLFYDFEPSLLPEKYGMERLLTLLEYIKDKETDYLVCEQIIQVIKTINEVIPETTLERLKLSG